MPAIATRRSSYPGPADPYRSAMSVRLRAHPTSTIPALRPHRYQVHNDRTYPLLVRLFEELGVETAASDMSFGVACPTTGFQYSSRGLRGFFADPRLLGSTAHFGLLREILRFNRQVVRVVSQDQAA